MKPQTNIFCWLFRYLMSCFLMLTGLWMLAPGCGCHVPPSSNSFSTATARCGMGGKQILMETISGEYSAVLNYPTITSINYQVDQFQAAKWCKTWWKKIPHGISCPCYLIFFLHLFILMFHHKVVKVSRGWSTCFSISVIWLFLLHVVGWVTGIFMSI